MCLLEWCSLHTHKVQCSQDDTSSTSSTADFQGRPVTTDFPTGLLPTGRLEAFLSAVFQRLLSMSLLFSFSNISILPSNVAVFFIIYVLSRSACKSDIPPAPPAPAIKARPCRVRRKINCVVTVTDGSIHFAAAVLVFFKAPGGPYGSGV
jgi:hypothetical protein